MFDKFNIQVDRDLFLRFVEAIERIAPPVAEVTKPSASTEEDVISMTDEEYNAKEIQWHLDDLVEGLRLTGGEGNEEEIRKLTELKGRLADPEGRMEREDD